MKLILLFGPPAVGKMTVGRELARLTGLKLFHNHLSIELVHRFFEFGTPAFERLDRAIRFSVFEEVAKSNLPGLIFTLVWAFNEPEDAAYVDEIVAIFAKEGADVCFVELRADLEVRLKRNRHEDRLARKASKRDVERSERSLLYFEKEYRMHAKEGELDRSTLLRIDNTDLSPQEVARRIQEHFGL